MLGSELESPLSIPLALFLGLLLGLFLRSRSFSSDKRSHRKIQDHLSQGLSFLLEDKPSQALDNLIEIAKIDTSEPDIYLSLAILYRRQGDSTKAIRIIQSILFHPELIKERKRICHLELARNYHHLKLLSPALTYYHKVMQSSWKKDYQVLASIQSLYEEACLYEEAIKHLKLQSAKMDKIHYHHHVAGLYFLWAKKESVYPQNTQSTLDLAKQALKWNVDSYGAFQLCWQIYLDQKDDASCVRVFERAAKQNAEFIPSFIEMWTDLAEKQNRLKQMLQILEAKAKTDINLLAYPAAIYRDKLHDAEKALKLLHRGSLNEQNTMNLWIELIKTYLHLGRDEDAIKSICEFMAVCPKREFYFTCLSCLHREQRYFVKCSQCKTWTDPKIA